MRDQYAGDISDLIKFSFLRAIASNIRLGVAWYYMEDHDGRRDGRHREYVNEPSWSELDPVVFDSLKAGIQSVQDLERAPIWESSTKFHRIPVPGAGRAREDWFSRLVESLSGSELVFADPDNGLSLNRAQNTSARTSLRHCIKNSALSRSFNFHLARSISRSLRRDIETFADVRVSLPCAQRPVSQHGQALLCPANDGLP